MFKARILAAVAAAALAFAGSAEAIELITNGDFETGTTAGWTVTNLAPGSGDIFISTPGSATPVSGSLTSATGGSGSFGSFYAVSDQSGPGTHALSQTFTLPAATTVATLHFDMFVNDSDGGPIVDPIGLDHNGPDNQHARVDVLTAGAAALSTAPSDVVANLYLGVDPQGSNPNPFTAYAFDLLAAGLVAGETYQLRFAETDNQFFLNQGVDNVSVMATVVPEPSTLAALLGLAAVGVVRRTTRRRR